jgi:hypothetical protein
MSNVRRCTLLGFVLGALALSVGTAHAQSVTPISESNDPEPFVVITGHIDVPQGTTVTDAVIFNGDVHVEGAVTDNVIAFNGDVVIDGSVGGDVVALSGRVTVSTGARVGGDVASDLQPSIAPGTVSGQVRHANGFRFNDVQFRWIGRFVIWLIATCSSFLLGLALTLWMPRAADALARTGATRMGASFGFGALWFFAIPIAAAILAATVIAGLIGLALLLALLLIYVVAYAVGAFLVGRRLLPRSSRFMSFLAAWVVLRLIALIPVVGGIAWFVTVILGLGAIAISGWRAARTGPETTALVPPMGAPGDTMPPVPPMPV